MALRNPEKNPILQRWTGVCLVKENAGAVFAENGEVLRTFSEVNEASKRWAQRFSAYPAGVVVGLQMGNGPEWPEILLGIWQAGHVVLPMDFDLSGERRQKAESACRVAVRVGEELHRVNEGMEPFLEVGDLLKLTSGTSGEPRAIRFSAEQLLADCDTVCETMGLREADRNYGVISFAHSYGFSNLITPLICRGIPVVASREMMPRAIADGLATSGATVFPGVPAIFRALSGFRFDPNTLRLCISAGAPLSTGTAGAFREAWGLKVHSFYGASECGGICYDASDERDIPEGYVGSAMKGVQLERLSDAAASLIRVRSNAVGLGYFPGEQRDPIHSGIFEPSDLLTASGNGYVIAGRVSDFINIAGRKANPAEIERVISRNSGVGEVVVFGVPGGARGEDVAACVVGEVSEAQLKTFCAERLPAWQLPRHWFFLDTLPVNNRGKLSRTELRKKLFPGN